jgi:hypothetical protein
MVYINKVIKGASMQLTPIASNMTEVETSEARILFSYRTPVAAYVFGQLPIDGEVYSGYVKTDKWWSTTTSRHINKWGAKEGTEMPQSLLDSLV